jgi:hypothetical protein
MIARHWRVVLLILISAIASFYLAVSLFALAIFVWGYLLLAPFRNFTFTDSSDFICAGLIVLTLAALAARHRKRPYPAGWVTAASVAAVVLVVLTPLLPWTVLYLLSRRAQELIGHWPQMTRDDPKYIGMHDSVYQGLLDAFGYAEAYAGWSLFTWGALMLH